MSPSGGFPIKVTIKEVGGTTATVTSSAVIAAASLVAMTLPAITTTVNATLTNKVVAEFQDDNPLQTSASTYAGTLNWGDGTTTTASFKFVSAKSGVASYWDVLGTHKYVKKGTYTLTATIHEPAGECQCHAENNGKRRLTAEGTVSMSETIHPTKNCPNCDGRNLFANRVSSAGGHGPRLLPGLGHFLHNADFDVVVCADCGLTRFFAEPSAYKKVATHPEWQRIT